MGLHMNEHEELPSLNGYCSAPIFVTVESGLLITAYTDTWKLLGDNKTND